MHITLMNLNSIISMSKYSNKKETEAIRFFFRVYDSKRLEDKWIFILLVFFLGNMVYFLWGVEYFSFILFFYWRKLHKNKFSNIKLTLTEKEDDEVERNIREERKYDLLKLLLLSHCSFYAVFEVEREVEIKTTQSQSIKKFVMSQTFTWNIHEM